VDGQLPLIDIFGRDENLTSAESAGETLTISEDKKCVLGLTTLSTAATEKTITVYGQNVGYEINVEAYTKIVDEAEDLDYFLFNNENSATISSRFNGYYVLANDIDATGYVRGTNGFVATSTVAGYATVGLTGTFDGRGHVISNLTFGEVAGDFEKFDAEKRKEYTYSLFGVIGGGTVKNFALDNVTFAAPAAVTKGNQAALATWIMGGTIENVYVRVKGLNYADSKWRASAGFAYSVDANTVIKNCIIEVEDDGTVQAVKDKTGNQLGAAYGALVGERLPEESVLEKNWTDVYVISKDALSVVYKNAVDDSGKTVRVSTVTDATNANEFADRAVNAIKRYKNIADFLYSDNDYSEFSTSVWTVNAGSIPVWKGLESNRYARVTVNGEPMKELTIDVAQANGEYSIGVEVLGEEISDYAITSVGAGLVVSGNTFKVLYAGTTQFTVVLADQELTLTVNVTAQTTIYAKTVEFSAMHGELPLADIFGSDDVEIVAAFQGERMLTISENKKCVWGVQTLGADGKIVNDKAIQTQITVYTTTKGAVITLNAYAGILTKAEDLQIFCLDNTDYENLYSINSDTSLNNNDKLNSQVPTRIVEGYYVLGNDIDASATTWTMPTQGYIGNIYRTLMDSKGFQGTFDGCGYTIKGLTFGGIADKTKTDTATDGDYWKNNTYSLFGILGKNAVVKNFALTNVKYALTFNGKAETKATCAGIASYISSGAMVENVYVSVEGVIAGGDVKYCNVEGFAYAISATAKLNNIVVDCENVNSATAAYTSYGSFVGRKHSNDNTTTISTDNWKNIYVISSQRLYAVNPANNILYAANEGKTGEDVVTGLYKYSTVSDWLQATHDYRSFENEYWNLSTGIPKFKTQN
jgi:hypothetical protein